MEKSNMFYLFDPATMKVYGTYKTERGAKIAYTRKFSKLKLQIGDRLVFDLCDDIVEVENLLSKKKVKIRRSELGGPCDPSTERYWSM